LAGLAFEGAGIAYAHALPLVEGVGREDIGLIETDVAPMQVPPDSRAVSQSPRESTEERKLSIAVVRSAMVRLDIFK
jgi:hypothetical protein